MGTNARKFRLALTWLTLVALLLPVFGAVQVWADPGPILVPVFGDLLPDYTADHPPGYPFDPSGMRTSSFLINTQLHGTGWQKDERLFEAPTGRTQGIYGGLPPVTTNSASIDVANPFLQNVQTSPGWTSLARVEATGDDWPGGSDGSDSFLLDIIVQSGGGKSWQEANAHLHARYSISDPGWTYGHNVTLSADFTPDVDWTGAVGNRDVRVVFGWALGPVVDFYHDWGPREDPDQLNDLLTAHYDAIAAGDGDAFYYSYIFPYDTPTAQSDELTLFVASGETFDIDAFLRGHITNNYSSPKSNGTIDLVVSVERVVPPDNEGPITSNVAADPNPASLGTAIDLTANVDDFTTGGSNIASAEYNIDGGSWSGMSAQDSAFDEVSEDVTANIGSFEGPGVHDVCVRGTDAAGNLGGPECILLAIYDPTAGFVTGGGWIDSPSGAYTPDDPDDPDLTGKATFGFVSRYKKGATVPTGQTEFQFRVADLNFHSTSYQWLVIAGARAQYKGSGTINGAGDYGFMLTAIDGQINGGGGTDKFRIKIWDKATDSMIYDNKAGESDTGGAATELGGGSIVIHKGK